MVHGGLTTGNGGAGITAGKQSRFLEKLTSDGRLQQKAPALMHFRVHRVRPTVTTIARRDHAALT